MTSQHVPRRQFLAVLADSDAAGILAKSTKSSYLSGVSSFLRFCIRECLPPIPSVDHLCMYIANACRTHSSRTNQPLAPNSIQGYVSTIAAAFEHLYPNVRLATNSCRVRRVLRGIKIQFSKSPTRKDPLCLEDLITISFSPADAYDNVLFTALILTGFHGLHRLGEITWADTVTYRDRRKLITQSTFQFLRCGEFARYTLPHCKTDLFFQGSAVVLASCNIPGASLCTSCEETPALRRTNPCS